VQPTDKPPEIRPQQQQRAQEAPPPPIVVAMYCSVCGAGNPANRHFCISCGNPLVVARPRRVPWWQRLFPPREAPAAGTRPAGTGSETTAGSLLRVFVVTMLIVVLAGGLLAYAVAPGFHQAVNRRADVATTSVRRLVDTNWAQVHPETTRASSDVAGHPAEFATDLVNNDYWAADTSRDPQPTLVFTFTGPTDLDALVITSGAAADYAKVGRPKTIQITYSDGTGDELTLSDDPHETPYYIYARQITSMTMRITSVYPAPGSTSVALTEVEFRRLN
jgi:hypothetical protein